MSAETKLDGARALITGAGSGIGEATARALAARGSHVLLLDRDRRRLDLVADAIRDQGHWADSYVIDLSDAEAIATTVAQLVASHGCPDVLVNNAGAGRWLSILETSAEEAAQMITVPYLGAFNLTREVLPGMLTRGSGQIVNVTSVAARLSWPGAVAYSGGRAAMQGFTNALRADLYGSGIGVTLAMFGTVESPYWQHNPGSRERVPKSAQRIRVLSTEEVASLIANGIEKRSRTVIAPAALRLLFVMSALFPSRVDASMAKGARAAKDVRLETSRT
jgi:short-subunit dehydrogenase